ncbi:MAG TPA: bifunctional alpha,alpha-trehalose-phosphate synthase (UDP-forming)/trehalose-phosphatase, partial [Thermodesulfobacteriota bacterium]|nr:bifunctional alpha,alpha-trehalose-phosphate synthase (UDP-forming)/trehalose-phosphatase [Thermodesulfobacteriota bacterium]
MNKIIFVSNRLPVTIKRDQNNELEAIASGGGLVTALSTFEKMSEKVWIGWPGVLDKRNKSENDEIKELLKQYDYRPVSLNSKQIKEYYEGFCNETIWPLFHYFVQYAIYEKTFWDTYRSVNQKFCDAVLKEARHDSIIWIHDYHLLLLPNMIRQKLPDARIGFFLHIPFPSSEIFRLIPWCREIIDGLLGSDVIGFHTFDYVRHFAESVRRIVGIEHTLGQFTLGSRAVRVDTFPMGIDYNKFSKSPSEPVVKEKISKLKKEIGGDYKVILSIDRLDYTKGIPNRLQAIEHFLDNNPGYKQKVIFIVVAVPSRTEVEHYKKLKENVEYLTGKINGKHGSIGWTPIWYLYRSFEFDDLIALYSIADILYITPIRDGMNLVAKEYVATKNDGNGVLILGEMAGTAKELGEAIIINPNDIEKTSNALKKALEMHINDKTARMKSMQKRLKRYDIKKWTNDFMDRLSQIKDVQKQIESKVLAGNGKNSLINDYKKASKRLLLLDYDGTLMPFNENPANVSPDKEVIQILSNLKNDKRNTVVIVSGRDRGTLQSWLGNLTHGMVAEHGVWIKNGSWSTIEKLDNSWKDEI